MNGELQQYLSENLTTGRIGDVQKGIETYYKETIDKISVDELLNALCFSIQLSAAQLDVLISSNSAVLRTVRGHAFELVFDEIMRVNGVECLEVGGDSEVDRIVDGHTLQLKTPYQAGTHGDYVGYKTHKTHGAKSERESMDYYTRADKFADYFVGLISYHPMKILIISKDQLPRVKDNSDYILSPFEINLGESTGINNFDFVESGEIEIPYSMSMTEPDELLPLTSNMVGLSSETIVRTIFDSANFRIWDMNMRGFARESALFHYLETNGVNHYDPIIAGKDRSDKSDLALKNKDGSYCRLQVKGITFSSSTFVEKNCTAYIETQLSRGRVNDHPTQSRLYYETDFDFLIVCLDPVYSNRFSLIEYKVPDFSWNFFCIPISQLRRHPKFPNRINSGQKISYTNLCEYKIDRNWLNQFEGRAD